MTRALALAFAAAWTVLPAIAQQPATPPVIKIVVPFAAGGSTDITARAVARELGQRLKTTVVVESRPGAGGLIGADYVAKAPKDGSVLLIAPASVVTSAAATKKVPFDILSDLQPISMFGEGPMVVAVPTSSGFTKPSDLIAAARARPDALTYGSAGVGSIDHLTSEVINDMAKIRTRHIPYKGTALALTDLATGTIDWVIATHSTLVPQIQSGRVRVIGVTGSQASPAFPDVLPMASAVPGFHATTWVAMLAPSGTPAALIQFYNREINEASNSKPVADQMRMDGVVRTVLSPAETAARVRETYTFWKRIVVEKQIVIE
jgi:tripartite-type tricarboxylate transporter receptor subunit TctC